MHAIREVRAIDTVTVWGRDPERRAAFAQHLNAGGIAAEAAPDVRSAVAQADIICTTTAAKEPILFGADVGTGTHVNVVGSSYAGATEIDVDLVVRARFFADHAPAVRMQGAEFLRARASGRIDDAHLLAEIGDVFDGSAKGRTSAEEITIYKSLGQVAQDLSSAWHVYEGTRR